MIRPITNQAEIEALAVTCGAPPYFEGGYPFLEESLVVGAGDPLNIAFFVEPKADHEAYVHVMVDPKSRGKEAIAVGKEFLAHMKQSGIKVVGVLGKHRREVILYARLCGMEVRGESGEYLLAYGGAV